MVWRRGREGLTFSVFHSLLVMVISRSLRQVSSQVKLQLGGYNRTRSVGFVLWLWFQSD